MGKIVNILVEMWPVLRQYFGKNKGLNTVSGGFLGAAVTLLAIGLQQTQSIDQMISWLQNQGENGLVAGAFVAGLRVAVFTYKASKSA